MDVTAAVSRGASSRLGLEQLTLADPGDGEVLVRMVAVGVCHTDLAAQEFYGGTAVVLGHEGAGVVEAVGADVRSVARGDHVILSFHSCGRCRECRSGHRPYCQEFTAINTSGARDDGTIAYSGGDGPVLGSFFGQSSFSSYALATSDNVVRINSDVDLTMVAPFGCGFQTGAGVIVNALKPDVNDRVAVFGAGGVGMAAVMAARVLGVSTIVAVDLSPERRAVALEVGATHVVDGASATAVEEIRDVTGGGATHSLDTTSAPTVITSALAALAPRGTLVIVGSGAAPFTLVGSDLIVEGKSIRGSIEGDANPQEFIPQLVQWHREGRFPVERLITTYPFERINDAINDARAGSTIKPVLVF